MDNILNYPVIRDIVLPFVLIFTLIFAILQKSKLLGENKQQIDAILAFVVAGILVTFSTQVDWIQKFSVFLGVALFIYFIFMLIWGFSVGTTKGDVFENYKGMKVVLGAIAFVAVVVAVLMITDTWNKVANFFISGEIGSNIILLIVIIGAIVAALYGAKKPEEKKT